MLSFTKIENIFVLILVLLHTFEITPRSKRNPCFQSTINNIQRLLPGQASHLRRRGDALRACVDGGWIGVHTR